jgi:hypothetical protein
LKFAIAPAARPLRMREMGSLYVIGGARIIAAGNRRCGNTTAAINRYGRRVWRWVRVCY